MKAFAETKLNVAKNIGFISKSVGIRMKMGKDDILPDHFCILAKGVEKHGSPGKGLTFYQIILFFPPSLTSFSPCPIIFSTLNIIWVTLMLSSFLMKIPSIKSFFFV